MTRAIKLVLAAVAAVVVSSCGQPSAAPDEHGEHEAADAEFERGPHRGRMLRDGDFALEVTIFEEGVPPEFRVFAYLKDKPIAPSDIRLTMRLSRLGGKVDDFTFTPVDDYLRGSGIVHEPHSFDVKVVASRGNAAHEWSYASYEGRTTIEPAQAEAAGVKTEAAGSAQIDETIAISGRVELQPQGRADVRAWYPGRIVTMTKAIGERVRKGETLARVTSSESLQTYSIPAPISGVVMQRNANAGDVADGDPLYVIADATKLHAELFIYPRDAERLRPGQKVVVRDLEGDHRAASTIEVVLPTSDMLTQTVIAHVELPNPDGLTWRPGQAVEALVTVGSHPSALAVRTHALQRFRDFTVVFAKVDDTYEVRMLELGRQSPEWTEVLGGLDPGEVYVTDNSFLIRADIEKSGASHDH